MSASEDRNGRETNSIPDSGILAALPRARPQRASARRTAARAGTTTKTSTATKSKPARTAVAKKPAATRKRAAKPIANPVEPRAPKQGYEPEEELELGATVHPPSSTELVESVADIVGELAGAGLVAGGRLLKDAFSILRRP